MLEVAGPATHLVLQGTLLTEEAHCPRQVLAVLNSGQDLLLLTDPALLLSHLPEELPETPGLFQAGTTLCSQLGQLLVAELQVRNPVLDDLWVAWLVAWIGRLMLV